MFYHHAKFQDQKLRNKKKKILKVEKLTILKHRRITFGQNLINNFGESRRPLSNGITFFFDRVVQPILEKKSACFRIEFL